MVDGEAACREDGRGGKSVTVDTTSAATAATVRVFATRFVSGRVSAPSGSTEGRRDGGTLDVAGRTLLR